MPPPRLAVKLTCRLELGSATGYTAEPAVSGATGVSTRLVPDIRAPPLLVHPPPGGLTAACPAAAATPVPVTGTLRVCVPSVSVQVNR